MKRTDDIERARLGACLMAAVVAVLSGCQWLGYPDKAVGIDGYFARVSEAGALLGTGKILTIPKDAKYLHAEYNEDTAFFSPTTKTRSWEFTCTGGTNWVPAEAWTAIDGLKKYRQAREDADAEEKPEAEAVPAPATTNVVESVK